MRSRNLFALAAVAALIVAAAPPLPSALDATTAPTAPAPPGQHITVIALTYVPEEVTIEEGASLTLTNADLPAPHNVTAREYGEDGGPLFASDTIAAGQQADVTGTSQLAPGTYDFYCTVHPTTTTGTLEVIERVTPESPVPVPDSAPVPSAGAVATPTSITVRDDTMYAASWSQGTVEALPILEAGLLGPAESYATGFRNPLGIVFDDDGWLYVADSHPSARDDRDTAGRVWAIPPGGGDAAEVGEVVVDELPNGRHNTNGMAIRGDRLYVTNGNSTDDGVSGGLPEEPLSGTLISIRIGARELTPDDAVFGEIPEPDEGEELVLPDLLVEATGMRNNFDVAFRPGTTEAWMTVNGPDQLDPYGEDTLVAVPDVTFVHDAPTHFGFPECVYANLDGEWDVTQNEAVATTCGEHTPPEQLLGLHVAATGLAFGPDGDLVLGRFGNFFGTTPRGRDIVRLDIGPDASAGEPETIAVLPAPLDVTYDGDNLYAADFALGQILLIAGS
ncbi:MAG: cupredoxin domain-containing protein [Actinobacteria bacterium]|nr:cupredoxin domain-containing protein [Actinomycetota bacterium]